MNQKLTLRTIGFGVSLLFTFAAYLVIASPQLFHLKKGMDVAIIFALAALQSVTQLVCFIDVWQERGPLWNLIVFVSTISVIVIIVAFSIWIMDHLDYNMMPWMRHGCH